MENINVENTVKNILPAIVTPTAISEFVREIADFKSLDDAVNYLNNTGMVARDVWLKTALTVHMLLTPLPRKDRKKAFDDLGGKLKYGYSALRSFRQAGEYLAEGKELVYASNCFSANDYLLHMRAIDKEANPTPTAVYTFGKKIGSVKFGKKPYNIFDVQVKKGKSTTYMLAITDLQDLTDISLPEGEIESTKEKCVKLDFYKVV